MRQRSSTIIAKDVNEFLEQSETITRRQERSSTLQTKKGVDLDNYDMIMDENELLEEINDFNNYLHPHEQQTDPKLLCSLLKEYIKKMSDINCPIRASLKKNLPRALSYESLDKVDLKDYLTNLVSTPSTSDSEGIGSLLNQNVILEEDIIKVMFVSLYKEERESVLRTFIGKTIEE
jgi:hypothetical protein